MKDEFNFEINIDLEKFFEEEKKEREKKFNLLTEKLKQFYEANKISVYDIDYIINYLNNKGGLK